MSSMRSASSSTTSRQEERLTAPLSIKSCEHSQIINFLKAQDAIRSTMRETNSTRGDSHVELSTDQTMMMGGAEATLSRPGVPISKAGGEAVSLAFCSLMGCPPKTQAEVQLTRASYLQLCSEIC